MGQFIRRVMSTGPLSVADALELLIGGVGLIGFILVTPAQAVTRWTYDALNQRLTERTPTPAVASTQRTSTYLYDEMGSMRWPWILALW